MLIEGDQLDLLEGLLHIIEVKQEEVPELLSLNEELVKSERGHLGGRGCTHDLNAL
jgi:hypothetical protein